MSVRTVGRGLMLIGAGLLLAIAGEGPDFGHYTDWAAAALSGDIFDLRGNVLSPGGVPFSVAAPGPGLLFAVGKLLLFPLSLGSAALIAGWVAALVFWSSALVVLRRVADDDWLVLFGIGALFVGTHAGLYSHTIATEVFADATIAALWALVLTRDEWRWLDSALVGAITGLLLLVRAHLVLYAAPALWVAVFGRPQRVDAGQARGRASVIRFLVTAVPIAVALVQYATVNKWMTGSLTHPPYVYGGEGFTSVDLWHPQVMTLLTHPWHGLLSYHPLYGVAFAALAVCAWRGAGWRALGVVTLIAVVLHVWVQAGWYIWWLGGSTFGMRGMAPAALPLIAALLAGIRQDAAERPARAAGWIVATLVACAWSYPLLLRGNTTFYSWAVLLASQHVALNAMAAVALGSLGIWASRSGTARQRLEQLTRAATVLLLAAVATYFVVQLALVDDPGRRLVKGLIGAALLIAAGVVVRQWRAAAAWREDAALLVTLGVFATQALLFEWIALDTGRYRASGSPPPRGFEYVGASPMDELRVTYAEYLGVPGFEDRKAAFRRFLAWQRIEETPLSADERRMSHEVRKRYEADPAFGDLLVEPVAHGGVVQIAATGMSDAQQSRARELALSVPGVVGVTFSRN